jgi:hypothetical protein
MRELASLLQQFFSCGARKGSGLWLCLAELLLVKKIAYLDTVENQLVLIFYF